MTGPTKHLPVAIGFGLDPGSGSSGGARPESITVDPGLGPRRADSRPEPKEPVQEAPLPESVPEPVQAAPLPEPAPRVYEGTGEEDIDALHRRFDTMEDQIKKRLAVATLHVRFDALEAWLKARFGE